MTLISFTHSTKKYENLSIGHIFLDKVLASTYTNSKYRADVSVGTYEK